jgi:molecular chaperone DnaJ
MAAVKDLYEVLGVVSDASDDDIKRAYRKLARELHPDVNQHDPEAEERFKEISAAYEVLSDPAKRRQYDMWGQTGGAPDLFPFGDLTDIFDVFFGGGRRQRGGRTRVVRGGDLQATISLSLEDAAFGVHRELQVESVEVCGRCGGNGCEPGTHPSRCSRCGGTGEVQDVQRSIFGTVMTARSCPTCEGTGQEIGSPCRDCRGDGRVGKRAVVTVEVPAGVTDGLELRISGAGDAGRSGGMPGDLYVRIVVEPHGVFARRGTDLMALLEVPFTLAALGGEVEIQTLDGPEKLRIEQGAESGSVLRLKGHGVPNLGRRGRGDLYVQVQVETPAARSKEERELLERLAELRGEPHGKGKPHPSRLRHPES